MTDPAGLLDRLLTSLHPHQLHWVSDYLTDGCRSRPFLERYAELADASVLDALLAAGNAERLREYLHGRYLIDVVREFPLRGLAAAEFVGTLRRLPPRLYSIDSSHRASADEVHLRAK